MVQHRGPEYQNNAPQSDAEHLGKIIDLNVAAKNVQGQRPKPGKTELEGQYPGLFGNKDGRKINGAIVKRGESLTGGHGNTFQYEEGISAKNAAEDRQEAARLNVKRMEEAQQIEKETDELEARALEAEKEVTNSAAIPTGAPEADEVASLDKEFQNHQAEAAKGHSDVTAGTRGALEDSSVGV